LILIVGTGAALRFFPIWFGFPYGFARPDEEVSTSVAAKMLAGDFNPHFFHWPSFTFDLLAALYFLAGVPRRLLTGQATLTYPEQVVIGRTAVACAGTLTVVVLYHLGRRVAGELTGLTAAMILAVALLHVRESHFAMADVLMTFWVTLSLALLLRAMDGEEGRFPLKWWAAAGLAGGLAASTKYNAAAIVVAMAVAQLWKIGRWREALSARAWFPSAAFGLAFGAGFLVATPYAVLDHAEFRLGVRQIAEHLSGGHHLDLGRGWVYHLKYSLPFGLGVTAFAAAVAGMIPLAVRHPRHASVLGAFVAALYLAIGSGYAVFYRYILPIIPVLCIPAAVAVNSAAQWLSSHRVLSYRWALAGLLALTIGPGLVTSAWFDVVLARTDTRVIAGHWLLERLQPDDTLYDAGSAYVALDLHRATFHQWYFDPVQESFGHPEQKNPDWIVTYQSPLEKYARTPFPIHELTRRQYVLAHTVRATKPKAYSTAVYDQHDAFFMPMWGIWTVERPGPTIRVYRRKDLF
jgi:4-amino-4-deoxy-L-arabinose transferase-like glycosyltransferase